MNIAREVDIVTVRQRAKQIAELLGYDSLDQTRIATSVSEISRNAYEYAGQGRAIFSVMEGSPKKLVVEVVDKGPGIANLDMILAGSYISEHGMGVGLLGARQLVDHMEIENSLGQGVTVRLFKRFPVASENVSTGFIDSLSSELAKLPTDQAMHQLRQQNQELFDTMKLLAAKQQELFSLNRELEDTNRGVLALYAELDEKAEALRRANEVKTSFLSSVTHEFRTPVNSVLNLSGILLGEVDGALTADQRNSILLIQKATRHLSDMINDLLDLAKVEAGKIAVRPGPVSLSEVFSSLRGLFKPLMDKRSAVNLVIVEPDQIPAFYTDEGKLAQILRNFVSNALKFTEQGEVQMSSRMMGDEIWISVSDTGIGIAPENREKIFDEFSQIDSPLQRQTRGTGLGLPLARKLAHLLGGRVYVESQVGAGSTFSLHLPSVYRGPLEASYISGQNLSTVEDRPRILIVDDDEKDRLLLKGLAQKFGQFDFYEAISGYEGLQAARHIRPNLIFLDLFMDDISGLEVLSQLGQDDLTARIPVAINSSCVLDEPTREVVDKKLILVLNKLSSESDRLSQMSGLFRKLGLAREQKGALHA